MSNSSSVQGFVYICRDGSDGLYKIGFTRDPERREKELTVNNSSLTMLFHFPAPARLERELHRRYSAHRVRNEWFQFTEDEIEAIRTQHTPKNVSA